KQPLARQSAPRLHSAPALWWFGPVRYRDASARARYAQYRRPGYCRRDLPGMKVQGTSAVRSRKGCYGANWHDRHAQDLRRNSWTAFQHMPSGMGNTGIGAAVHDWVQTANGQLTPFRGSFSMKSPVLPCPQAKLTKISAGWSATSASSRSNLISFLEAAGNALRATSNGESSR